MENVISQQGFVHVMKEIKALTVLVKFYWYTKYIYVVCICILNDLNWSWLLVLPFNFFDTEYVCFYSFQNLLVQRIVVAQGIVMFLLENVLAMLVDMDLIVQVSLDIFALLLRKLPQPILFSRVWLSCWWNMFRSRKLWWFNRNLCLQWRIWRSNLWRYVCN